MPDSPRREEAIGAAYAESFERQEGSLRFNADGGIHISLAVSPSEQQRRFEGRYRVARISKFAGL